MSMMSGKKWNENMKENQAFHAKILKKLHPGLGKQPF
jgi:hypothetical protein